MEQIRRYAMPTFVQLSRLVAQSSPASGGTAVTLLGRIREETGTVVALVCAGRAKCIWGRDRLSFCRWKPPRAWLTRRARPRGRLAPYRSRFEANRLCAAPRPRTCRRAPGNIRARSHHWRPNRR